MWVMSNRAKPPWIWPRAAYVHIPFCAHHCGYCDFACAAGKDHLVDLYLEALAVEFATLGEPRPVETIFLGGGTPTQLSCAQLERLLRDINHWLPAAGCPRRTEFTIEANPNSLDDAKVAVLAEHGISRVSLGAQSFQPHLLRVLERQHDPADVPRAVECVQRCIRQVSLDLIFGVPGQTLAEWNEDLKQALALGPDHLSAYGLTYEKGTRLWKQRERGDIRPLDEESELAMYNDAIDTLESAGFEHYEISNFARPGCQSRHNQVYWANEAYFGFGMGAARYVGGSRELNTRSLEEYIRRALAGESVTAHCETLSPEERAKETMAVQLRRGSGIDRVAFRQQTGFDVDAVAGAALAEHVKLGLLQDDGRIVRLT